MYGDFNLRALVGLIHAFIYVYTCRYFDIMDVDREMFCVYRGHYQVDELHPSGTRRDCPHCADPGASARCLPASPNYRETCSFVQACSMTVDSV